MSRLSSLALSLLLTVAAPAVAQRHAVELSPVAGYRWGGTLQGGDNGLFARDVDIDESAVFGVRLGFPLNDTFQIELQASRQPTQFTRGERIFGPDSNLADIDIDTLHVGFVFQGGDGQVHPYGVVSAGATRLAPDVRNVDAESRISAGGGGGVKVFFNDHVGMRFEGRVYWTDTDEADEWWNNDDLWQQEVTVGLVFGF